MTFMLRCDFVIMFKNGDRETYIHTDDDAPQQHLNPKQLIDLFESIFEEFYKHRNFQDIDTITVINDFNKLVFKYNFHHWDSDNKIITKEAEILSRQTRKFYKKEKGFIFMAICEGFTHRSEVTVKCFKTPTEEELLKLYRDQLHDYTMKLQIKGLNIHEVVKNTRLLYHYDPDDLDLNLD